LQATVENLEDIAAEYIPDGVTFQAVARHGAVYEEVLEVAEEFEVDQIVIGAHRPGAADFLLGTNTAKIVRHAKCSVTVVRE
jgi:nucleotide-binding universal stress UspA family protein